MTENLSDNRNKNHEFATNIVKFFADVHIFLNIYLISKMSYDSTQRILTYKLKQVYMNTLKNI